MNAPASKSLQLEVTQQGDATVVKVSGSVGLSDADQLRERLEALAADRCPVIVLDLGEMDFICSLGLGAIITGHLKCRHHQGQIRLAKPTDQVRELLQTTRLTQLFGVYGSVEDAVAKA